MNNYKDSVFTKVVSNHVNGTYNCTYWSSRLLCPPQIQLEAIRTGAVLTKKMNSYKDGIFTKDVSNSTSSFKFVDMLVELHSCHMFYTPHGKRKHAAHL